MSVFSFLAGVFSPAPRKKTLRRARRRVHSNLRLESLEQRDLFAIVGPDLALADVEANDDSAALTGGWGMAQYQYGYESTTTYIGGYGAASYQYANETTYDNPVYRGTDEVQNNELASQDKHVSAICHGVTVLAWARVDGVS